MGRDPDAWRGWIRYTTGIAETRFGWFAAERLTPVPERPGLLLTRAAPASLLGAVSYESPGAIRDDCVWCGSRPLGNGAGRIIVWSRPASVTPETHEHETLSRPLNPPRQDVRSRRDEYVS